MQILPKTLGLVVVATLTLLTPIIVSAQAYVPVKDEELIEDFQDYVDKFDAAMGPDEPDGTTESLRDLISGYQVGVDANGDPSGGISGTECQTKDARTEAYAYPDKTGGNTDPDATNTPENTPWRRATISTFGDVPERVPAGSADGDYVKVNGSASLRCLLQEIVEFQKLNASTQIHQILLKYISDAQAKQLANQLINKISAANIEFEKSGYTATIDGEVQSAPLYPTDLQTYRDDLASREIKNLALQITSNPDDPIGGGGLGYCDVFKLDAAQEALMSTQSYTQDIYQQAELATQCQIDQPGSPFAGQDSYAEFMNNSNYADGPGSDDGLLYFLNHPADAAITNMSVTRDVATRRAQYAQENFNQEYQAGGGVLPTSVGLDDPDVNPYGIARFRTNVTPSVQNANTITRSADSGIKQLEDTGSQEEFPDQTQSNSGAQINTSEGFSGYNTLDLQESKNLTDLLIKEFYNVIEVGYFDLSRNTTDWAQATMLMTYDEMLTSSKEPRVQLPQDAGTQGAPSEGASTPDPVVEDEYNF